MDPSINEVGSALLFLLVTPSITNYKQKLVNKSEYIWSKF
jgi:hypothetical protein